VKLRKGSIRARVKGDLPIEFTEEPLTAHGGLELFRRFLARSGFMAELEAVFAGRQFDSDYGSLRMALATIGLLLVGGSRLSHLAVLVRDPLFQRFARLLRVPSERTLSRWLKETTAFYRDRLQALLREVAFATFTRAGLRRATLDLDGTVIRTGECVDGAERGFNPHHPKDPSYYPLTAHLAQTGQFLGVWNRPGNVNDSVDAVQHLGALIETTRARLGAVPLEVRLDGAFCQRAVLELLTASGVEYALRVPMWQWLGVRGRIAARKRWKRIGPRLEAFSLRHRIEKWGRTERIVVFRKHLSGKRRKKDFQLDLFSPDDGHYEYSMVATNKAVSERAVWDFMAGRGGHEKTLAEVRHHLAFATVATNDWDANSTWQLLSAMTHNLVRQFQIETGASTRPNGRKRTYRFRLPSVRTLRFELLHLPARIARPGGRTTLHIAAAPVSRQQIRELERKLAA
jgi:hypothetical protein